MEEAVLPLFPLNVVLLPGSALPLHIFEERYRQLIRECQESKWQEFGVNFVDSKAFSTVGCTAVVREVLQRYPDGRLDIIVEGKKRYELQRVDETSAPYFLGTVVFVDDEPGEVDRSLAQETVGLYHNLLEVVYNNKPPRLPSGLEEAGVSFVIAQKAGMTLQQRQQLLEMRSENLRLQALHKYLTAQLPKLQEAQEIHRIIHNDGYIQS